MHNLLFKNDRLHKLFSLIISFSLVINTLIGAILYFTTPVQAQEVIEIWSIEDLDNMRNNLSGSYVLMRDLDFNDCDSYDDCSNMAGFTTGEGWEPVGNATNQFSGVINGNDHVLFNLFIDSMGDNVGFFGYSLDGEINNLGIVGTVIGNANVGGLVGYQRSSSIVKCHFNGYVKGRIFVGGLVGYQYLNSIIKNSSSSGLVESTDSNAGGLVGIQINFRQLTQSVLA